MELKVEEGTSSPSQLTKNILLIGSTGVGKSALGNFLVNPKNNLSIFHFEISNSFLPCTTKLQAYGFQYEFEQKKYTINIIDTPGLNESNSKNDLENMINVIKSLNDVMKVNLIVICVGWDFELFNDFEKGKYEITDLKTNIFLSSFDSRKQIYGGIN